MEDQPTTLRIFAEVANKLKATGMKQVDVARALGVTPDQLSKLLSDGRPIGWTTLKKAADHNEEFGTKARPYMGIYARSVEPAVVREHDPNAPDLATMVVNLFDAVITYYERRGAPLDEQKRAELRALTPTVAARHGKEEAERILIRQMLGAFVDGSPLEQQALEAAKQQTRAGLQRDEDEGYLPLPGAGPKPESEDEPPTTTHGGRKKG